MWTTCILALVIVADANSAATTTPPTPLYTLSRQTSDALRAEAIAKPGAEQAAALRDLCSLHRTLVADARYEQVDKLKELRSRIYSRLRHSLAELKRTEGRAARQPAPPSPSAGSAANDAAAIAGSLAEGLAIADASLAGPSSLLFLGGAPADDGQALVDLIERTINPASWTTNGGNGTIVYYQPLQCLVISASGEVHERVGGVLGGLRAAGQ